MEAGASGNDPATGEVEGSIAVAGDGSTGQIHQRHSRRQDGYWERGLSPWDLAAGVALVDLAGGTVTGYGHRPFDLSSGRVVAAGASLHAAITDGLSQVKPLPGAAFGAPEVTAMGS